VVQTLHLRLTVRRWRTCFFSNYIWNAGIYWI